MLLSRLFLGVKPNEDEDIRRNLGYVLSAKRGCGYFIPEFGLSDVVFRTTEEAVTITVAELRENIRLFEPRVEVAKINEIYDDDGRCVRLEVLLRRRTAATVLRLVVDLDKRTFDVRSDGPK